MSTNNNQIIKENITLKKEIAQLKKLLKEKDGEKKDRRKLYFSIFEFSPSGIVLEDIDGTIIDANPAWCKLLGYKRKEIVGKHIKTVAHPENYDNINNNIKELISGKKLSHLLKSVKKDGSEIYVQINEKVITLPTDEKVILSISQDMTKEFQSKQALKESQDRLEAILDSTGIALWDMDFTTSKVYRSKHWAKMLGFTLKEIKRDLNFWKDRIHPDDRSEVDEIIRKHESGQSSMFEVEHRLKTKEGNWKWILNWGKIVKRDSDGKPLRALGTHIDITKRKIAEEELQKSEIRYKNLFEFSPDPIVIHSKGKVVSVNKSAIKFFEAKNRSQLINKPIMQFVYKDYRDIVLQRLRKVNENGKALETIDIKFKTLKGNIKDVEVSGVPLYDKDQITSMVVFRDITDRKKMINKLQQSEESYKGLFNNASDAIYIQDKKGIFLDVNNAVIKMYGYPKDFYIGKTPEPLSAPNKNDFESIGNKIKAAFKGQPQQFEFWGKRKNGEIFPKIVRLNKGMYFGQDVIFAFAIDISEQKKNESLLKENEERFRTIVEYSHAGILTVDDSFNITYANKKIEEISGYKLKDIIGSDFRNIISGESRKEIVDRYKKRIKNEDNYTVFEYKIKTKAGKTKWIESVSSTYADQNRKIKSISQILDVTERKIFEEALKTTNQNLSLLNAIAHFTSMSRTPQEMSDKLANEIKKVFPLDAFILVGFYFGTTKAYDFGFYDTIDGLFKRIESPESNFDWNSTERGKKLLKEKKPICVYRTPKEVEKLKKSKKWKNKGIEPSATILHVPLVIGKKVTGIISIQSYQFDVYTQKDIDLLEAVGRQIAPVVEGLMLDKQLLEQRKQLIINEEKYRSIFNNLTFGTAIIGLDGKFQIVNQRFSDMVGYSIEEIKQMKNEDLTHPEDVHEARKHTKLLLDGKIDVFNLEKRLIHKNGNIIWIDVSIKPQYDDKGQINNVLAVAQDITERKSVVEALKISEKRFREVSDLTSDYSYCYKISEDGELHLEWVAGALSKITGYEQNELKNFKGLSKYIYEEDKHLAETFLKSILQGKQKIVEYRIVKKDKSIAWLREYAHAEINRLNKKVQYIYGAVQEITEQKEAENALRESEERFRVLFSQNSAVMLLVYPDDNDKILDVNKSAENYYGYSRSELLGMNFNQLSNNLSDDKNSLKNLVKQKGNYLIFGHKLANREIREVELYISPIIQQKKHCLFVIVNDITERQRIERDNQRLAYVVEQAAESIIITDINGTIQYVNEAFEKITGLKKTEAVGQNPRILKSGKHGKEFYQDMWDTITAGKKWQGVIINKRKNGALYYEKAVIFPIKNEEGEIQNFTGILRDITLERKLEQQLQQVQKMEAIGTLSGGIAHDFNNILTVINGHAEIALMNMDKSNTCHGDLISILNAGKRAEKLTNQLLAFSRKQVHELKVIDINQTIKDLDKMLRRLIPEDINIIADFPDGLPFIKADPGQIEQILINLIINARDAINEKQNNPKKEIQVVTKYVDLDDLFVSTHPGSRTGPHILLSVKDSGTGMESDVKNRIFEPFFTTKDVDKGTGLGLATVYGIVKQNDGSIYVKSSPGEGTIFDIYWPVTTETPEKDYIEKMNQNAFAGNETVLFVEDDEDVRNFACVAIKNFGYKLIEARNGKNALEILEAMDLNIDIVITDLIMPEMNGKELVSKINKIQPKLKVLYVSGYTFEHLIKDGEIDDNINFLQKPYSIKNLLQRIRQILDKD